MKTEKNLLRASLALNIAACCVAGAFVHKHGGTPWLARKAAGLFHRSASNGGSADTKASVYAELPTRSTDTVFLGDSLVNFGEWAELMGDSNCRNRGVAGNTTADVFARLAAVLAGKPRRVVLWAGINDLQRGKSAREAADGIAGIIQRIRTDSPTTAIYVLPVLPINEDLYSAFIVPAHPGVKRPRSVDVQAINDRVAGAVAGEKSVRVIDADSLLSHSQIAPQYTFDGLHLNGRGLVRVAALVKAAFASHPR